MLLRHMPEAEALRFLHDVVDVPQLESKLKRDFLGTKMLEEVPPFFRVFVHAVGHGYVGTLPVVCTHYKLSLDLCKQWNALELLAEHLTLKGSGTVLYASPRSVTSSSQELQPVHKQ